jgi:hypothetical protein
MISKELQSRIVNINLPIDFEDRMCDIAIECLSDIKECDESIVYVKWVNLVGKQVPLLYVLFSNKAAEKMPRVHIGSNGTMKAAHAICLAKMPSGNIMNNDEIKFVIRKGVEEFITKHLHAF